MRKEGGYLFLLVFSSVLFSILIFPLVSAQECKTLNDIGNVRCHPTNPSYTQDCYKGLIGKVSWKNIKCPSYQFCDNSTGIAFCKCDNQCDYIGEIECSPNEANRYRICQNVGGCLRWSSTTSYNKYCTTRMICSQEANKCICNNVCNEGEKVCVAGTTNKYKNCIKDKNNCTYLGSSLSCPKNQNCSDGTCFANHCFDNIKNYDETDVDCGGECLACVEANQTIEEEPITNETIVNETIEEKPIVNETIEEKPIVNETNITIEAAGQVQFSFVEGDVKEMSINKGDRISVTYINKQDSSVILEIKAIPTAVSTNLTEKHKIKIENITEARVKVTIESKTLTKEINLGESVVFEISEEEETRNLVSASVILVAILAALTILFFLIKKK